MIKVLIADDHPIVREGLKQIVAETSDIVVKGEAGTGKEVLELANKGKWDVLLLDITMPGLHGLDLLKQVKSHKRIFCFQKNSMAFVKVSHSIETLT